MVTKVFLCHISAENTYHEQIVQNTPHDPVLPKLNFEKFTGFI